MLIIHRIMPAWRKRYVTFYFLSIWPYESMSDHTYFSFDGILFMRWLQESSSAEPSILQLLLIRWRIFLKYYILNYFWNNLIYSEILICLVAIGVFLAKLFMVLKCQYEKSSEKKLSTLVEVNWSLEIKSSIINWNWLKGSLPLYALCWGYLAEFALYFRSGWLRFGWLFCTWRFRLSFTFFYILKKR